jgi:hypothetical protein
MVRMALASMPIDMICTPRWRALRHSAVKSGCASDACAV